MARSSSKLLHRQWSRRRRACCCGVFGSLAVAILGIVSVSLLEVLDSQGPDSQWTPADSRAPLWMLPRIYMRQLTRSVEEELGPKRELGDVRHPVVMVPGIVSTGLELWEGKSCARKHFRERMWGTTVMLQNMILQSACWIEHIRLNYYTGLDPEGIKLRAAAGMEASDYLVAGFWVWAKMIKELASIGYDPNSMFMASYDWRLALGDLEKRDRFFTKLSAMIEIAVETNQRRKVVVVAHSWGSNVWLYFMKWTEKHKGKSWINENVHAFMAIGPPFLGLPKSLTSLLSGEMRDTAELSPPFQYLKNKFLTNKETVSIFRSWGSIAHMLPKGGPSIWGDGISAPDDDEDSPLTHGYLLRFTDPAPQNIDFSSSENQSPLQYSRPECTEELLEPILSPMDRARLRSRNLTSEDSLQLLNAVAPDWMRRIWNIYSFGFASTHEKMADIEAAEQDPQTENHEGKFWSNPLESALPNAPDMTIYCMYGTGHDVERSYFYHEVSSDNVDRIPGSSTADDPLKCEDLPFELDTSITDATIGASKGVRQTDGDITVPLISLGFMCQKGWKSRILNPHGVRTVTVEFPHNPPSTFLEHGQALLRERAAATDHVDIMGNHQLISDIMAVVTGLEGPKERVHSRIQEIVQRVPMEMES